MGVWSTEKENFIKDNWYHMTSAEIARNLNVTQCSAKTKIERMIKLGELQKKDELKDQVYGNVNLESILEENGRDKTQDLYKINEGFKLKQEIRVKTYVSSKQTEITEGIIIQKTDYIVAVKTKNYIRSFKYKDFFTRNSIVI